MSKVRYEVNGTMLIRVTIDGLEYQIFDEDKFNKDIYDLFDGEDFLQKVEDNCLTDYDGHIADVFIDGYKSNLGLSTNNLNQGELLINAELWKELCKDFKIEVNWANK